MIDQALQSVVAELNQHFVTKYGIDEDRVLLSTLVKPDGGMVLSDENVVVATLIAIEREIAQSERKIGQDRREVSQSKAEATASGRELQRSRAERATPGGDAKDARYVRDDRREAGERIKR